jgi:hypothetical protein
MTLLLLINLVLIRLEQVSIPAAAWPRIGLVIAVNYTRGFVDGGGCGKPTFFASQTFFKAAFRVSRTFSGRAGKVRRAMRRIAGLGVKADGLAQEEGRLSG